MTTTPPEHLLANFDPQKSKIAQLRGILLEHDVPYPANANKAKLVGLYEEHIRPVAPRLLATLARVQPSTAGILDGESQDGSLVELDTGSESAEEEREQQRKAKGKKKVLSKKKKEIEEKKGKGKAVAKGKGRKAKKVEESESESESEESGSSDDQMEVDEPEPPKPKSKSTTSKPRKSTLSVASTVLEPSSENGDEQQDRATSSPKKRKSTASAIAGSSAEKARQSLAYSSGPESGFSDYNPFQSGAEDTPERKLKRRKSSMGPNRRSTLGGGGGEEDEDKLERKKARKSMPASLSRGAGAGAWADDSMDLDLGHQEQQQAASSPAIHSHLVGRAAPAPVAATPSRLSLGGGGTPKIGERYMIPIEQVKKTPEEAKELKRRLSRFEVRDAEPEPEVEVEQEEEYEQPVDFGEESAEDELAIQQAPPPPASASKRKSTSTAALKNDQPATPLKRLAAPSSSALTPRKSTPRKSSTITVRHSSLTSTLTSAVETTTRLSLPFLLLSLLAFSLWYREEKLALGFCDTTSSSSSTTPGTTNSLQLTRGDGALTLAPYLPTSLLTTLDSLGLKPTCTPCPPHARCAEGQLVSCDPDFAPRPHPLRLGGLLPLPPRCEPDTEKLMIVAGWAAGVKKVLEERRGNVMCGRERRVEGGGEGRKFGMGDEELWSVLRGVNLQSPHPYKDSFLDEITRLALRDLEQHGEVVKEEEGTTIYYSTPTFRIPLTCRARLSAIRHAKENKMTLSSLLALLFCALYGKWKLAQRKVEKEKVRELVGKVLGELRKQDHLHHLDPALCPVPHLAQSHLRDFILQSEHSPSRRQRLWNQVEKVVEGNSNVRTKMVEVMGEELRGWQWTGQGGVGELSTPGGKGVYPKLEL